MSGKIKSMQDLIRFYEEYTISDDAIIPVSGNAIKEIAHYYGHEFGDGFTLPFEGINGLPRDLLIHANTKNRPDGVATELSLHDRQKGTIIFAVTNEGIRLYSSACDSKSFRHESGSGKIKLIP